MLAIRRAEEAGGVGGLHPPDGHRALLVRPRHPEASRRRRFVNGLVRRGMR
jgi:hypothetical protein